MEYYDNSGPYISLYQHHFIFYRLFIMYKLFDQYYVVEFNLDDKIKSDIVKTMNEYKCKYESLGVNYFEFFDVGRKMCKQFGISADSLMQLCFQVI